MTMINHLRRTILAGVFVIAASASNAAFAADGVALEVVAVKLKAESDMEAFRNNDMLIAEWASKQPGFISRETGSGPGGEWFAMAHWASLKDAESAAAAFMQLEEGKKAMSMIDQNSMLFKHYVTGQ